MFFRNKVGIYKYPITVSLLTPVNRIKKEKKLLDFAVPGIFFKIIRLKASRILQISHKVIMLSILKKSKNNNRLTLGVILKYARYIAAIIIFIFFTSTYFDLVQAQTPSPSLTVSTDEASLVTKTSATLRGNIVGAATERGFAYSSTDATPTIGEFEVTWLSFGSGTGSLSFTISKDKTNPMSPEFIEGTTYYYRAYGTNSNNETYYGGVKHFTVPTSQPNKYVSGIISPTAANGVYVWIGTYYGKPAWKHQSLNYWLYNSRSGAAYPINYYWFIDDELKNEHIADNYLFNHADATTCPSSGWTAEDGTGNPIIVVSPVVASVTATTSAGTFGIGAEITINVNFVDNIIVTGIPQLKLETGTVDRIATYSSGSGNSTLVFTYTVQAGDYASDLDYSDTTALSTNGGTIQDGAGNQANLTLPITGSASSLAGNNAIVIDTTPPEIIIHHPGTSAAISKTITATISDGTLKMSNTREATCDGSLTFAPYDSQTFSAEADNGIRVCYQAVDAVNNISYKLSDAISGIDTTAPSTSITGKPANPDNSASLSFTFSGEDPDYTDGSDGSRIVGFECSLDGAAFSDCSSPKTYSSLSDGNHIFQVRSVDAAGNTDTSPESYTWQMDTSLPETTILSSPANPTNSVDADFSFSGTDPSGSGVSSFECSLDGAAFSDCSSPKVYNSLSEGNHTFQVRSVDAAGNADSSPAEFSWTVDTTAPEITIHHPGTAAAVSKTITATISDGTLKMSNTRGATCDGSLTFAAYDSQTFSAEADNGIRVCYQAVDAVNNTAYKLSDAISGIDTTAPSTSITTKPANPDNSANPSFTFSGEDPDGADHSDGSGVAGFECSLDGGAFSSCPSPKTYSSLGDGNHTFEVRSVDAAGNTDASPESYTWRIDSSLPETTILSSPANLTTSTDAVFEFEGDDPDGFGIENLECLLDSSAFSVCSSPKEYNDLPDGGHNFQVRAVDKAGNADPSPAEINWTIDTTAPTVLISSTESNPTNVNPIPITIQFSEPVTGFEESDILPGNSTISGFLAVDSSTYSLNLIPTSEGTVTLDIPANVAVDAIGFSNLAAEQFSIVFGLDLVITSPDHASFIVGSPNTFDITTSGIPFPTISTTDDMPAGISLIDHHDGTATLEGIPDLSMVGTYQINMHAVNVLSTAQQDFTLTIEESAGIFKVGSIADTGDGELSGKEHTNVSITLLLPVFSKDMQHRSALDPFDVLNSSLYHLKINDLVDIPIDHVTYDNHNDRGPFVATLSINGGIPLIDGKYKLTIDGSMKDRSGFPIGSNFERIFSIDHQDPKTVIITIGKGNSLFTNGATIDTSLSEIKVTFDEDVSNSGNGSDPDDVTNPFNYLLLQTGPDNVYNTNSCLAFANNGNSPLGDDIHIPTGAVTYDNQGGNGPFVATIALNEG